MGGHAGSFPVTLAQAFTALGFEVAPKADLSQDPHRAVQQCLFLLGNAVNRLRNEAGTGHGRPGNLVKTQPLTPAEARLVARDRAPGGRHAGRAVTGNAEQYGLGEERRPLR